MPKLEDFLNKYFYGIFFGLGFVVYYKVIFTDPLVDIDYNIVIEPLKHITSLSDYFSKLLTVAIYDFQPIRDLSLWIDLQIEGIIGHQVHGFFNALLWMATCLVTLSIIKEKANETISHLLVLCLLTHPILSWVLSWPSARKHILSCFFLSLTIKYSFKVFEEGRESFKTIMYYTGSLLSQPIVILFPFVFSAYAWLMNQKNRRIVLTGFALFILSLVVGIINLSYYNLTYEIQSGSPKQNENPLEFAMQIAAFSRELFQIFIPITFARFYSSNSIENFLGIPILIFLSLFSVAKFGKKMVLLGLMAFLFPLIFINIRLTNVFVSDTYLIFSLFFIALILPRIQLNTKLLLTICFVFALKTSYENTVATSKTKMYETGFEREPSCKNALSLANDQLQRLELDSFYDTASIALNNRCLITGVGPTQLTEQIYGMRIFLDEDLEVERKVSLIGQLKTINPRFSQLKKILKSEQIDPRILEKDNLIDLLNKKFNKASQK